MSVLLSKYLLMFLSISLYQSPITSSTLEWVCSCQSIYLSFCLSVYLLICLCLLVVILTSRCLWVYLAIDPSLYLSVCTVLSLLCSVTNLKVSVFVFFPKHLYIMIHLPLSIFVSTSKCVKLPISFLNYLSVKALTWLSTCLNHQITHLSFIYLFLSIFSYLSLYLLKCIIIYLYLLSHMPLLQGVGVPP